MDYIFHLILLCGIYIILAMSLNLINGKCGQFSLGHAGFWAVGAYAGASFTVFTPWPLPGFVMLILSFIVSFLAAALAGTHHWRTLSAPAGRLFGHCHPGLWRNYSYHSHQHRCRGGP